MGNDVLKIENERYFQGSGKEKIQFDVFENKDYQIILAPDLILIKTPVGKKHLDDYEKEFSDIINMLIVDNGLKITMIRTELCTRDFIKQIGDVSRYYKHLVIKPKPRERQNINREYTQEYPKVEEIAENLSASYEINYFNEMRTSLYKKVSFSTAEYYNSSIGKVETKVATYLINSQVGGYTSDSVFDVVKKLRIYAREELMDSFTKEYIEITF